MTYKSTRLLSETIHREMDVIRRILMVQTNEPSMSAMETLNELRTLVEELSARADRPSLDDVQNLAPGDYVATMKPLVATYHRQLHAVDRLAASLCEDLRATAAVVVLIGDESVVVRTARDPRRPEAELAVEAILDAIDGRSRQVVEAGAAFAREYGAVPPEDGTYAGIDRQVGPTVDLAGRRRPLEPEDVVDVANATISGNPYAYDPVPLNDALGDLGVDASGNPLPRNKS